MKVLVLAKYGTLAASTRYRFLQFSSRFQLAGIELHILPLFDDDYLREMFAGRRPLRAFVQAFWRRLRGVMTADQYDLVVLHYEAYPYLPAFFEAWLHRKGVPYVYDFDDAVFHQYDQHRNPIVRWLYGGKIREVIRNARAVVAGNEYLADYARQVNSDVEVVPTVVDTERYTPRPLSDGPAGKLRIGWIGSPSTAHYVVQRRHALQKFCEENDATLVMVGAGSISLEGVPLELREWQESTEIECIHQFDIGIMPLDDSPWSRGKCGFKLIQYMACGVPVVASPVGINRTIVDPETGRLAETDAEWIGALTELARDRSLRTRLGANARQKVLAKYSVEAVAPQLISILTRSAKTSREQLAGRTAALV